MYWKKLARTTGRLHPTQVLNALIVTENEGGLRGLRQLERRLAHIWLQATRAYLVVQAEHKRAGLDGLEQAA